MVSEVSSALSTARLQRRRITPKYLSDYQLGFGAHCKHHSLCLPLPKQQTLFHSFLVFLQHQIAELVQTVAAGSDGTSHF